MTLFTDTFTTPFGPFSSACDAHGSLVATAFGDLDALRRRLGAGAGEFSAARGAHRALREQVLAYCAGECRAFSLSLAPHGTAFQLRVWDALQAIPLGETRSYGQLAALLDNPAASRAIGRANATNPICLIIPCHRVIGADGSLTGFAFGEDLKRRLLDHESSLVHATRAA